MAFTATFRNCVLAGILTYIFIVCCTFGKEEEDLLQTDVASVGDDPAQVVAKALLCFNDSSIYSSCEGAYRLNEKGNLNVSYEYTDEYCSGPCMTETLLVLNCIDNIFTNFVFYNKATVQDVSDTIKGGCGNSSERGNFNVAEHIKAEKSKGHNVANQILFGIGLMITARSLFL